MHRVRSSARSLFRIVEVSADARAPFVVRILT